MKTYTVDSRVTYWVFVGGAPCFFAAFGAPLVVDSAAGLFALHWRDTVVVAWLSLLAWGTYGWITMPHTIEVTETGDIRLVGVFRTVCVKTGDVRAVQSPLGSFP